MFYDERKGYYFKVADVGFCVWKTEKDANAFLDQFEIGFKTEVKKL